MRNVSFVRRTEKTKAVCIGGSISFVRSFARSLVCVPLFSLPHPFKSGCITTMDFFKTLLDLSAIRSSMTSIQASEQ